MIEGRATREGTERYRRRFEGDVADGHFREVGGLHLSSIGLGTYLGDETDAADAAYEEAVVEALGAGCNVIDTAINYRHQRSERAVGRAVARAIAEGVAARDEIFVATKGGFLPFDGDLPDDPGGWLRRTYIASGLVEPSELAAGCHAMTPRFLAAQVATSRTNLGLETVDLYYLHNPETQSQEHGWEVFSERVRAAFEQLSEEVRADRVARYGVATWNALRSPEEARDHLGLQRLRALAPAGSPPAAVQLPLNLAMPEGLVRPTQPLDDARVPALVAARRFGMAVFTSASILQGRLGGNLPPEIAEAFPALETPAQRALQFARSAPGVTTALVGMGRSDHVRENLAVARVPPAASDIYRRLFGGV